jgi:hypothetical protein
MGKKCMICGEEAKLKIKDTSDYYCEECAVDSFGDISVLVSVEEDAKKLKAIVEDKCEAPQKDDEELHTKDSFEEEEEKEDEFLEE